MEGACFWPAAPQGEVEGGGWGGASFHFSSLFPPPASTSWVFRILAHLSQMLELWHAALLPLRSWFRDRAFNHRDAHGNLHLRLPLDGDAWRERSGNKSVRWAEQGDGLLNVCAKIQSQQFCFPNRGALGHPESHEAG